MRSVYAKIALAVLGLAVLTATWGWVASAHALKSAQTENGELSVRNGGLVSLLQNEEQHSQNLEGQIAETDAEIGELGQELEESRAKATFWERVETRVETVYPTEFRQFASRGELSQWQAKQYPELQKLGRENGWVCVDYALEMQRRAWLDGYQMSVQLLDRNGVPYHAICSTWIGDECVYLEPQGLSNWKAAKKWMGD
jgi:TolA-binding protein